MAIGGGNWQWHRLWLSIHPLKKPRLNYHHDCVFLLKIMLQLGKWQEPGGGTVTANFKLFNLALPFPKAFQQLSTADLKPQSYFLPPSFISCNSITSHVSPFATLYISKLSSWTSISNYSSISSNFSLAQHYPLFIKHISFLLLL